MFARPAVVLAALMALAICHRGARLEGSVVHFQNGTAPGQFADVSRLLDATGIGSRNVSSETVATKYLVGGPAGSTVDLTFKIERDTGSFQYSFGFFDWQNVRGLDPETQKEAWATAGLGAAREVFDDRIHDPGDRATVTVDAGSILIFYLIPNNTLDAFNRQPDPFYPSQTRRSRYRSPLFSQSLANPGELDQMLAFVGNGVTLLTFEDLTRTDRGDEDFTDLAITIDREVTPSMPEPGSAGVWLLLAAVGYPLFRRMRRWRESPSAQQRLANRIDSNFRPSLDYASGAISSVG